MDKNQAIEQVNSELGYALLNRRNTHFSNVNAAKSVWWFNVAPRKFENDLHLLCATRDSRLIWLKIEANTFPNPQQVFRARPDNGLIDLEISSAAQRYMCDVKSGGSGYDFRPHVQREWP